MKGNRKNAEIVLMETIGGEILNIQSCHAFRKRSLAHRGISHATEIQAYNKSQEYVQSWIAKTSSEHRMQGTKNK